MDGISRLLFFKCLCCIKITGNGTDFDSDFSLLVSYKRRLPLLCKVLDILSLMIFRTLWMDGWFWSLERGPLGLLSRNATVWLVGTTKQRDKSKNTRVRVRDSATRATTRDTKAGPSGPSVRQILEKNSHGHHMPFFRFERPG